MDAWPDIGLPPGSQALDALAERYRDNCTRTTKDCTQDWICPSCKESYPPVRNLLVDLPAFGCKRCRVKNPAVYDWCITKTKLNGIRLDFMVYNQYDTLYCGLFAVVAAIDCYRRVGGALRRLTESAPLDVDEIKDKYESETKSELGRESRNILYDGFDNIPLVLRVVRESGISYFCETIYDSGSEDSIPRLFIQDFFIVHPRHVLHVTRLIASGFPLVTSILWGSLFEFLSADEVYSAPPLDADASGAHAVALIGSGMAQMKNGEARTDYVARNSKGEHAHSSYHTKRFGGDFLVWAEDVRLIWGFTLKDQWLQ